MTELLLTAITVVAFLCARTWRRHRLEADFWADPSANRQGLQGDWGRMVVGPDRCVNTDRGLDRTTNRDGSTTR
jgi:hypothetical protein